MLADTPLDSKMKEMMKIDLKKVKPTGDMGTGFELGCHFRIHLNHHVPLLCHGLVPFFFAVVNPISELGTNDCCTDINDPLLRNFWQIRFVREVVEDFWVVAGKVHDVIESQVLVLWYMQSLDGIVLEAQLLPVADISQKVNGHVLY
jgi:hypothetical protein